MYVGSLAPTPAILGCLILKIRTTSHLRPNQALSPFSVHLYIFVIFIFSYSFSIFSQSDSVFQAHMATNSTPLAPACRKLLPGWEACTLLEHFESHEVELLQCPVCSVVWNRMRYFPEHAHTTFLRCEAFF